MRLLVCALVISLLQKKNILSWIVFFLMLFYFCISEIVKVGLNVHSWKNTYESMSIRLIPIHPGNPQFVINWMNWWIFLLREGGGLAAHTSIFNLSCYKWIRSSRFAWIQNSFRQKIFLSVLLNTYFSVEVMCSLVTYRETHHLEKWAFLCYS